MSEKGFLIGPAFAGALKELVDKDRGGVSESQYSRIETRFEDLPPRRSEKVFRICTFTGAWEINAEKEVTFRGVTTTPNTVSAMNLFFPVTSTATNATTDCAIAKDGAAWYLIDVPFETATAVFMSSTATQTVFGTGSTAVIQFIGTGSTQAITYVTGVSASLNTASCAISVTAATASATLLSVAGTQTAISLSMAGTQTVTVVGATFTSTFLRFRV